jgi:hypothetical protein
MLSPDLISKLNLIAFEGWEYHKLPLEDSEYCGNSRAEEKLSLSSPYRHRARPDCLGKKLNLSAYRRVKK